MEKQENQNIPVKIRIMTSCDNYFDENFKEYFENEMKNLNLNICWREEENSVQTESKPLFDDKTIDVIGNIENINKSLKNIFDLIVKIWCSMKTEHWLVFVRNDSSEKTIKFYSYMVKLNLFCMGTLTSFTNYVFYHSIENNIKANFFHIVGILEIKNEDYRLQIKYSSIRRILAEVKEYYVYIFIDVIYPPPVFKGEKRVLTLPSVDREIHGNSTVFMIQMDDVKTAKEILARFRIFYNMTIHYVCMKKHIIKARYPSMLPFDLGQFDCNYNLCAILTRTFAPLEQLIADWENFIKELKNEYEDKYILSKAFEYILYLQEKEVLFDYKIAIKTIYEWLNKNNDYITENNMKFVRKLILTPTRILLYPQEYQCSNRMLRNFNSDFILQVLFRDDDNLNLNGTTYNCDDELLYMAIDKPMLEGITIAGRHYELLAWSRFSNFRIRDDGVWMYAKDDNGYDVDYIRKFMGEFSRNKSMARLEQCFSQIEDVKNIPDSAVETVDDIEGGLNPVTDKSDSFSDEIGKMSLKESEEHTEIKLFE